jgi:hypothetical protein
MIDVNHGECWNGWHNTVALQMRSIVLIAGSEVIVDSPALQICIKASDRREWCCEGGWFNCPKFWLLTMSWMCVVFNSDFICGLVVLKNRVSARFGIEFSSFDNGSNRRRIWLAICRWSHCQISSLAADLGSSGRCDSNGPIGILVGHREEFTGKFS